MKFVTLSFVSITSLISFVTTSPLGSFNQIRVFPKAEPELRLVQYSNDSPPKWMTEDDKLALIRAGIKFMDITDYPNPPITSYSNWKPFIPEDIRYQDEASPFIGNLTTEFLEGQLTEFSSFHTRYYKSDSGAKSCRWLLKQIKNIADGVDHLSVDIFEHAWNQFSIIARFEGSNLDYQDEVIIIGAHQDSLNAVSPLNGRSPGADDDGSGTVTIMEAFRSLAKNGFRPEKPVEFHWYSAEEGGLLGSQDVSNAYQRSGRLVNAMLQIDMTGYAGDKGEVIAISIDENQVDPSLTEFLKILVNGYADIPYRLHICGFASSDHTSWHRLGYPSGFLMESVFEDSNHNVHTPEDTVDKLNFDHMKQFAKVAVGFAVELSHQRY